MAVNCTQPTPQALRWRRGLRTVEPHGLLALENINMTYGQQGQSDSLKPTGTPELGAEIPDPGRQRSGTCGSEQRFDSRKTATLALVNRTDPEDAAMKDRKVDR